MGKNIKELHNSYNLNDKAFESDAICDIIELYKTDVSITAIAVKYNVTVPTVYKILKDNNIKLGKGER